MRFASTVVLLIVLFVWECEGQCIAQLSRYVRGFEASRTQICETGKSLVLTGETLEPVMETVAKILDNQPLKGGIPDAIGKVFPQIRAVVTRSSLDLCNNKEAKAILRVLEQAIDRDLASFDRVLEPYCESYLKFLESKVGQNLLKDVDKLLRDFQVVPIDEIAVN